MTSDIKQQFFEHYLAAGMPEVYAAMAVEENYSWKIKVNASATLVGSFVWENSALGHDFWYAIFTELKHENN
jgi:hypothetical protein